MSAFDELGECAVANEADVTIVYNVDSNWVVVFTFPVAAEGRKAYARGCSPVLSIAVSEALDEAGW